MPVNVKDLESLKGKIAKAEAHLTAAKKFAVGLQTKLRDEKAKPTKAK